MRHDICPNCHNDIHDNTEDYCPHCGTLVTLTNRETKTQQCALFYEQAKAAAHQQDRREAIKKLIAVLSIDPEYKDAAALLSWLRREQLLISYEHRALRYCEQKKWDKARHCYRKILELNPRDENAAAGLRQVDQYELDEKRSKSIRVKQAAEPVVRYLLTFLLIILICLVAIVIVTFAIGLWK
jgi:tetratricopeptide (TPR) repeat protein